MSLKTVLKSIGKALGKVFSADNLSAAEAFIAKELPEFKDAIAAFSTTLASEKTSLFALAEEAQALYKAAKGVDLSTSLATHLAQAVLNTVWPAVEAEAEKLLKLK